MAERLTEYKTTKGVTRAVIKPYVEMYPFWQPVADKLCAFEDIMEKYGIENVEELENIFKTHHTFDTETSWVPKRTKNYELMIQIMLEDEKGRDYEVLLEKILSHTKKQLDTWQKACELACEDALSIANSEGLYFGINDTSDNISANAQYFYKQAKSKKEGKDE